MTDKQRLEELERRAKAARTPEPVGYCAACGQPVPEYSAAMCLCPHCGARCGEGLV